MFPKDEFKKYAVKHLGISSATLHNYMSIHNDYISPTVIEERQLNVASMDIFSRLMMDQLQTAKPIPRPSMSSNSKLPTSIASNSEGLA